MKQLHTTDIVAGDGQKMRQQMVENFEIIQHEDLRIDDANSRMDQLEQEKATRDELKDAQEAWKKKIEHVALGTDYETVEQAVMQILKETGLI